MVSKTVQGRPKIMQDAKRVLVQLEREDYTQLRQILDISVAEFFRQAVRAKLHNKSHDHH
jgi:hypothetical protein